MSDTYEINDDNEVIPYTSGRRCNDTRSWRNATDLELQQRDEIVRLESELERERDELDERLDFQKKLNRECIDQITSRTKERDEARDRADTMFANYADILDQARRERDEAREQLDAERELADWLALALKMTRWDSPVTCKKALTAWKEARDGSR